MILSADPGITGALCCFDEVAERVVTLEDMPTFEVRKRGKDKTYIHEDGLVDWFRGHHMLGARRFVCEKVQGLPRQSAPGAFTFGYGYGAVLMAARMTGFEVELVRPQEWKMALRVLADKKQALARATALLPADAHRWPLQKHHGRAEAAMIGLYGARHLWAGKEAA